MQQINIKPPKKVTTDKKPPVSPKQEPTVAEVEEVEDGNEGDPGEQSVNSSESFQAKEEPKIFRSEEVDLNAKGPEVQGKTKVNFVNPDFMANFVKKKTEESKSAEEAKSVTDGKTKEEIAAEIKKEEAAPGSSFSKEELMDFAEVFIDILDMLISTGLRFYSGDTSTTAYELPIDKKRKLTRQITNLFIKYQTKFSLEFMFIITLFICYSVPARKAHQFRKAKKAGIQEPRGKGKPSK